MRFKKYPAVLTGQVATSTTGASLAVPCRGAMMVVARLRATDSQNVLAGTVAFTLGSAANGATFVSTAGQGYATSGTAPITLQQGPACWALYCSMDGTAKGAMAPFYFDWVKATVAPGANTLNSVIMDIEVWYEFDADIALREQLGTNEYTPV